MCKSTQVVAGQSPGCSCPSISARPALEAGHRLSKILKISQIIICHIMFREIITFRGFFQDLNLQNCEDFYLGPAIMTTRIESWNRSPRSARMSWIKRSRKALASSGKNCCILNAIGVDGNSVKTGVFNMCHAFKMVSTSCACTSGPCMGASSEAKGLASLLDLRMSLQGLLVPSCG